MPIIDVEQIRVAAERVAYDALAQEEPFARLMHVPVDTSVRRRHLLATALLLTDAVAPDAYAAAREAMATLGVDDEIELFQSKGDDAVCLTLFGGPIGIELIGAQLEAFDRGSVGESSEYSARLEVAARGREEAVRRSACGSGV